MKKLLSLLVVLGLVIFTVGCGGEDGSSGSPAASDKDTGANEDGNTPPTPEAKAATVWGEEAAATVGAKSDVTVSLNRDKGYMGVVKATVTSSDEKILKVEKADIEFAKDAKEAKVSVTGVAKGEAKLTFKITEPKEGTEGVEVTAKDITVKVAPKE